MANATTRSVKKMIEVETIDGITLELDNDEAAALHDVLRRVGGAPECTRRGFTARIVSALIDADVPGSRDTDDDLAGSVWFTSLPMDDDRLKRL